MTFLRETAVNAIALPDIHTSRGTIRADRVVVCPGDDFTGLYAERLEAYDLTRCKLQMLRLASPGFKLPGAIMSDLGLARYRGYSDLEAAAPLKARLAREQPKHLENGIHLIVVQSADGTLEVGDSHHYATTPDPFAREEIDALILEEFSAAMGIKPPPILERWTGTYASASDRPVLIDAPEPSIRVAIAAAWKDHHGRISNAADMDRIMERLGPLMREHAARASTLIPGARETFDQLRAAGLKTASSTGYTREMMAPVLARAAEQGYTPGHVVCSGETLTGRPSPLMIYKACTDLGVWPLSRVIKVDDAEVGIAEGKAAGAFTVGVASGNALGLSLEALNALPPAERAKRIAAARQALLDAGADLAIDSVATLIPALELSSGKRI